MNTNLKKFATIIFGKILFTGLLAAGIFTVISLTAFQTAAQEEKEFERESSSFGGLFRCGTGTLMGKYAVISNGFAAPPPAPPLPFGSVSLMVMDGNGSLTNKVTRSNNGNISRGTDTGTYTVNSDCTGTITIATPNPPFQLTFDLVVADVSWRQGREFYFIATTPGGVVTATAKRIY